jgi:hypothetical protein
MPDRPLDVLTGVIELLLFVAVAMLVVLTTSGTL